MLIYDDIYAWSGWGGKLKLGSGKCRLRIYDLKKGNKRDLMHLRPIIVVVSDVKDSNISVRSCSGHIATLVTKAFNIDPLRMLWVEYYPEHKYGAGDTHFIPEKLDAVEFSWYGDKAIQPKYRPLVPPLLDEIKKLIRE
jgi:hypothetical protein